MNWGTVSITMVLVYQVCLRLCTALRPNADRYGLAEPDQVEEWLERSGFRVRFGGTLPASLCEQPLVPRTPNPKT